MKKLLVRLSALSVLMLLVFASVSVAQNTTPPPFPPVINNQTPLPTVSNSPVYINEINMAVGNDLTANVGPDGVVIPLAVRLSTGQQLFDLRGLPLVYQASSPAIKGGYDFFVDAEHGTVRIFSKVAGPVILTIQAPTTALGSPSRMYTQVVVNFMDVPPLDFNQPLLVVANTQKASAGQTASHTIVLAPGNYPKGDYWLIVQGFQGNSHREPIGPVVQPGQAIPLPSHMVLPYDQGGWMYGSYQLVDYTRQGFVVARGSGYANIKYSGFRNLDARADDIGNINFDVNSGDVGNRYRVYLVTTDGFAVELPVAPAIRKQDQGIRLTYYKNSMPNAPLFTAGEYTPVVVESYPNGGGLVHSLPNAIHLDGDQIPFPY